MYTDVIRAEVIGVWTSFMAYDASEGLLISDKGIWNMLMKVFEARPRIAL